MANSRVHFVLENPWQFARRVLVGFSANQGLLLSGAVAYYTLLTIIPMFALILVGLSQFQETQPLLETLREYLALIAPDQADALTHQISAFLENWKTVGVMGILLLLFFSSFAFTSLENAMSVIFFHRVAIQRRHFLISAIIPYCYILLLAVGMLLVSTVSGSLHTLDARSVTVMGYHWS
ncbi:MAG: ribonuclease R, partial [Gammaproteobacteria bacterium]|nr:ribonuclease R [Gammaproteobacteria bacterium]